MNSYTLTCGYTPKELVNAHPWYASQLLKPYTSPSSEPPKLVIGGRFPPIPHPLCGMPWRAKFYPRRETLYVIS